jgi:23S rRNA pseudouridine1911/1915/1917 synthase
LVWRFDNILNKVKLTDMNKNIKIIYEDNDLLVIDKPKGLLVHPSSFNEKNTLVDQLRDKICVSEFDDQVRPGIVHRLDRNTSGLILVVKNKLAYDGIVDQIHKRTLVRKYLTVVHRQFDHDTITIKAPIARSKQHVLKMVVSDDVKAKPSVTEVKVIKNLKDAALIECQLLTGRTHQVRVHLAYIHHPIYNDGVYGKNDGYENYDQFLHAHYLSFTHPITKAFLVFNSQPDQTFNDLVKKLSV